MRIVITIVFLTLCILPSFAFVFSPDEFQQTSQSVLNPKNLIPEDKTSPEQTEIENYTQATLNYFINPELGLDPETGLAYDHIRVYSDSYVQKANYTSITNVGLQLASISTACTAGMLTQEDARKMIEKVIRTLREMEYYEVPFGKYRGCRYYFNYYGLNDLKSYRKFISSIDNAWLATGLIIARECFPEFAEDINSILSRMDFGFFYNPRRNLFRIGYFYNPETNSIIDYGSVYGVSLYENLNSETRIISYLAIGKDDIPEKEIQEHLAKFYTEPKEYRGIKVIPSVGGSAFEHGMPNIFVDEINLSPLGLGINLKKAFYIQMLQAKEKGYPIWGESPCTDENYGYATFGSPAGISPYESRGIITPHATFLALEVIPEKALKNLENILLLYPEAYSSSLGFVDAIDVKNNRVFSKYLALDQAMAFLSGVNFSTQGLVKQIFMDSKEGRKIADTVEGITFFTFQELREEINRCIQMANNYLNEANYQVAEVLLEYIRDLTQDYNL